MSKMAHCKYTTPHVKNMCVCIYMYCLVTNLTGGNEKNVTIN